MGQTRHIDLATLRTLAAQMPGLTPALGEVLAEATVVCLEHNHHTPGVRLPVGGEVADVLGLVWPPGTEKLRRAHGDLQEATERAATCIAIFVASDLLGLAVAERSRKGTGFDYFLAPVGDAPELFQNTTRLEVSGILSGEVSAITQRLKQKCRQVQRSAGTPACIIVVEFGRPESRVAR